MAKQRSICAAAGTCDLWRNTSNEDYRNSVVGNCQRNCLVKWVNFLSSSFFDLFDFRRFGLWGPWVKSIFWTLGIILPTVIIIVSLACCTLSKVLSVCMQTSLEHQVNGLLSTGMTRAKKKKKKKKMCNNEDTITYKQCAETRNPKMMITESGAKALSFGHTLT